MKPDREPWIFASVLLLLAGLFGVTLKGVFAVQDERRNRIAEAHRNNISCLARNVYYEARGEPLEGQYAVAEVTMNRKASPLYPRTVCEVVHQRGAFSWTLLGELPAPAGVDWKRAWTVAEAVYYGRQPEQLRGALFYHSVYIKPHWAKGRKPVARIGKHIFYR